MRDMGESSEKVEFAVSDTTSRATQEEPALSKGKTSRRGDESRMESLTDEEVFSDEEEELRENVRMFLRPKSLAELEARLHGKPLRLKRNLKKVKLPAADHEIRFWNTAARGKIVIGLDLQEVEEDLEYLCTGEPRVDKQTIASAASSNASKTQKSVQGPRSSKGSAASEVGSGAALVGSSTASGNSVIPGTVDVGGSAVGTAAGSAVSPPAQRKRSHSSRTNIPGHSDKFSMHRSRKGWLVCNSCRSAIWPPNSRKHAVLCGQ